MTNRNNLFKDVFFDKWYFWDESWTVCHGPFDEYTAAHAAMSEHIEAMRDQEKESTMPSNCS